MYASLVKYLYLLTRVSWLIPKHTNWIRARSPICLSLSCPFRPVRWFQVLVYIWLPVHTNPRTTLGRSLHKRYMVETVAFHCIHSSRLLAIFWALTPLHENQSAHWFNMFQAMTVKYGVLSVMAICNPHILPFLCHQGVIVPPRGLKSWLLYTRQILALGSPSSASTYSWKDSK